MDDPNFFLRPLPPSPPFQGPRRLWAIGARRAKGASITFGARDKDMQYNYVTFPHSFFQYKKEDNVKRLQMLLCFFNRYKTRALNGAGYNSPKTNGVINEQILSIINGYQITFYTLESTRHNAIRKYQMRSLPLLSFLFNI